MCECHHTAGCFGIQAWYHVLCLEMGKQYILVCLDQRKRDFVVHLIDEVLDSQDTAAYLFS